MQYAVFGLLYYLQAEGCIKGVMHYSHALWFSVQTSATIGYGGQLTPDPYCSVNNALVTCQVIISLLIDYSMPTSGSIKSFVLVRVIFLAADIIVHPLRCCV